MEVRLVGVEDRCSILSELPLEGQITVRLCVNLDRLVGVCDPEAGLVGGLEPSRHPTRLHHPGCLPSCALLRLRDEQAASTGVELVDPPPVLDLMLRATMFSIGHGSVHRRVLVGR